MKRFLALALALTMALAALPLGVAEDATGYQPLEYGSSGDAVSAVQKQLSTLGYYTGKISGNFLEGTRAAVKRFQKDYGLAETGVVDGEMEALLMSAQYRELVRGDSGDDVKRMQETLQELGYYKGKLSGNFLEGTQSAIKTFQERNGLESTGDADVKTQQALFSARAISKDAPLVTETPDPNSDLGDTNDVVIAGDGDKDDEVGEYTKKLSRGSKGELVKQVQKRLTELGYFDGPVSGNYMNKTVAAVKAFQLNNGLSSDGVTGESTWNLLFDEENALDVKASPRPTPVPTPIPYAITVDVRNQATIVYGRDDNGNYTIPVRRMICSTGMKATPSDVGDWTLNGRRARWCFFGKYNSYAQYWTRINAYIAFHSVIYNAVDYDALSTKSYYKLGQRASHGCIRLLVSDAKWVYENIGEGVVVTITEDLPDDPELRASLKTAPLSKKYKIPVETPQPTAEPIYTSDGMPPQPFRTLKTKSEGEDVYWLQMKLKELGYYTGTVTGLYLGGTEKAVKAYQKDHSIYPTGTAKEDTLEAIYADVLAANTPTPEPTPEPTFTPEITESPAPTDAPTDEP